MPDLKTHRLFTATETRKNAQFSPDGKWMASLRMKMGGGRSTRPLFQANAREQVAGSDLVMYDATRDGQRFLINT